MLQASLFFIISSPSSTLVMLNQEELAKDLGNNPLEEPTADIMLDLAKLRWEESCNDKRDMETKASIVIAADGVILGLFATVLSQAFLAKPYPTISLIVGAFYLSASATFCILVLNTRQYYTVDLGESKVFLKKYFWSSIDIKDDVYSKLAILSAVNKDNLENMEKWFHRGLKALLIGVAFTLLFIVLIAFGL